MSNIKKNNIFSSIRAAIWPIEGYEHKKFLPMALMMFCILLNYATFRSIKDSFVVTAIGAEAISFIKTYFVLPFALLFIIAYVKLCNFLREARVFYVVVFFFLCYFALFTFVLYPHPELVHPDPDLITQLSDKYPYFKWFIRIIGKWSFASFYVMAELWGSVMLSLLFWQFANKITKTSEAKRFYPMFGLLGNLALPVGGCFIKYCLGDKTQLVSKKIQYMPLLVILLASGLLIVVIYWFMTKFVLTDPKLCDTVGKGSKKHKVKLSLTESFKMIVTSKYLGFVVLLILAYGVSVNLAEGVWKSKILQLYPTKEAYTLYMGNFQSWQGYITILFMLIGGNILRKVSWGIAAGITPLMMLITGIGFFAFIFFDKTIGMYLAAIFASTPLTIAVMIGTLQNILTKATKYSLFDATKEMSYIPLDDELKSKGKAAVEVIGGRFGKSGGGIITSTTFILFPSWGYSEALPYFAAVFIFVVLVWLYAVKGLSKEYQMIMGKSSKKSV